MTNDPTPSSFLHIFSSFESIVQFLIGGGVLGSVVAIVKILWNSRVPMKKTISDAEAVFRKDVVARVEKLEEDNDKIRKENEIIRKDYENRISLIVAENEVRESIHERKESLLRHELSNTRACFNALMLFLKRMKNPPEELAGIIIDIETMRATQVTSELDERKALNLFIEAQNRSFK